MNLADAASSPAESPTKTAAHTPAALSPTQLSPAQRREIEIWFAQALDLSSERRREYAKADELFQKCLTLDGSNVLVVTAYLQNLARWRGRQVKSTWRGWWERRAFGKKQFPNVQDRQAAALAILSREPETRGLSELVGIAKEQHWELAEEAYLREALLRNDDSDSLHLRLAEICVGNADFHGAEAHLKVSFADSDQSAWMIFDCVEAVREPTIANEAIPDEFEANKALEQAKRFVAANQFTLADRLLSRASDASGHSLALREAREDVQLAQLQFQFDALAKLEQEGDLLAAKARGSLRQKLMRLQLDIAGTRAGRFPDDWTLRLNLVEQLIRVGNYFEALRRLNDPPAPQGVFSARALRLKAETQQRLKRYEAAMSLYLELLDAPAFSELSLEEQQRVRAQSQRLSAAMGSAKSEE